MTGLFESIFPILIIVVVFAARIVLANRVKAKRSAQSPGARQGEVPAAAAFRKIFSPPPVTTAVTTAYREEEAGEGIELMGEELHGPSLGRRAGQQVKGLMNRPRLLYSMKPASAGSHSGFPQTASDW
jgi:hypothetical protein